MPGVVEGNESNERFTIHVSFEASNRRYGVTFSIEASLNKSSWLFLRRFIIIYIYLLCLFCAILSLLHIRGYYRYYVSLSPIFVPQRVGIIQKSV